MGPVQNAVEWAVCRTGSEVTEKAVYATSTARGMAACVTSNAREMAASVTWNM